MSNEIRATAQELISKLLQDGDRGFPAFKTSTEKLLNLPTHQTAQNNYLLMQKLLNEANSPIQDLNKSILSFLIPLYGTLGQFKLSFQKLLSGKPDEVSQGWSRKRFGNLVSTVEHEASSLLNETQKLSYQQLLIKRAQTYLEQIAKLRGLTPIVVGLMAVVGGIFSVSKSSDQA